jgi:hypothetical protein
MQFLHAQGCPWDYWVPLAAARRGLLEMLRWARQHGCNWNEYAILSAAASSGSLEMTIWVKQQPGVECNRAAIAAAAQQGHTAICEYLHAAQCPFDEDVCNGAILHGHVDTLRWLRESGCPWNVTKVYRAAAVGGSVDVLLYLQQQGIMFTPAVLTDMLNAAGAHDKLAAAHWLRQQGAEWPDVLRDSAAYLWPSWSGTTLAWARAEGCTSPSK